MESFFSPLIYKPKVLFIGINPGGGEDEVFDCDYDKGELEYLHNDYTLAKETKKVFKLADRYELLFKSVKTNYYYLGTSDYNEIFQITNFLGRGKNDLGEKFLLKSREWTKLLIEIIEPELIICEGKEAYALVTDLFMQKIKMEQDVEQIYADEIKANIIGYKRVGRSYIKNKTKLAATIANLINEG